MKEEGKIRDSGFQLCITVVSESYIDSQNLNMTAYTFTFLSDDNLYARDLSKKLKIDVAELLICNSVKGKKLFYFYLDRFPPLRLISKND